MSLVDRVSETVTRHSTAVILVVLLVSVLLGTGMGQVGQSSSLGAFEPHSKEAQKLQYIETNFQTGAQNTTAAQVIVRGDDVLDKESLQTQLAFEQRLRENATVAGTLAPGQSVFGIANIVATAALRTQGVEDPTLAQQRQAVAAMNESQIDRLLAGVLRGGDGGNAVAFGLMPTNFEPGSTSADATMLVVTQTVEESTAQGSASDRLVDSQLAVQSIADDTFGDAVTFGAGIISDEINRSMTDSLLIVGPLALIFVLLVLIVAYRDLVDILLGLFGIALVLVWTFGFMGWAGYTFNQIFVAVPVLLIGLSIDYAIHVFMRHREERQRVEGVRSSMQVALASVGVALFFVTATTVIGFLSNLISSLPPIREFGIVSSFGIVAAFVIFGGLVPALKVAVDDFLESRGVDRNKRAFGTGGGVLARALAVGSTAARRAPAVVILLTVVLSAGGAYGATQVDTTFKQQDFIADDPPNWMKDLPEPFAPGEYNAKDSLDYVNQHFLRQDSQAQILVQGDVTSDDALERVADAERAAADSDVAVVLANDRADVRSPVRVIQAVAAQNQSFAQLVAQHDQDGDGVPDQNLGAVYDALYRVAPQEAASVVYRAGPDDYRALRLVVSVQGDANGGDVTDEMRDIAAVVDGGDLSAIATGQVITFHLVSEQLLQTVVESLLITLVAVFAFLMATYRITDGSATLGFVTLLPVAFSVAWILGTMYLAGIPFNVLTGMITSLTVGLGVAYSIHVSERYAHELERQDDRWEAMEKTVTGTGGALLGSAATTVGGFGVLSFAILPPLRQFGIITGLTIIYAFLASVLVLPSLLAYWTRYLGPGE